MQYGIFRISKLKTMGNLIGSLKHARREQYTPNADPARTVDNLLLTNTPTVRSVIDLYEQKKPEKIRNDQVRALEVLVTASPEAMAKMTEEQRLDYLKKSLAFANNEMGGEQNLLHAEIHNDETTAHLTAFYIPVVAKKNARSGKVKTGLNAKELLGDKQAYSDRQTRFHRDVSSQFGLERGEIGSKAQHTTIRDFYRQANQIQSVREIDLKKLDDSKKNTVQIERKGLLGAKTEEFEVTPYLDENVVKDVLKPVFDMAQKSKFFGVEQRKRNEERRKKQIKDEIERKTKELEQEYQKKMQELAIKEQELNQKEMNLVSELEKKYAEREGYFESFARELAFECKGYRAIYGDGMFAKYHESVALLSVLNDLKQHVKDMNKANNELNTLKTSLNNANNELNTLKANISDPNWLINRFEQLQATRRAEERKRELERARQSSGMRMR